MTQFRKKPIVIEATQWTGKNWQIVYDWIMQWDLQDPGVSCLQGIVTISTLEGEMTASHGDFIIRGIQGEFYPCKPDIFEATYENVGEDEIDGADAGITWTGLAGYEAELKLEVNGQTNSAYISHLFFEHLKDLWEAATIKEYGMSYKECLLQDLDNFNAGLPKDSPPMEFNRQAKCEVPPEGWWCSRGSGHEGPCAATAKQTYAKPAIMESLDVYPKEYVNRLHYLIASMVGHLQDSAITYDPVTLAFFDAWMSTFEDPDAFPEVTKIVEGDKS